MENIILHIACRNNNFDVVQLLLNYHPNSSLKNKQSLTPLMEASKNGHQNIVKLLIDNNLDNLLIEIMMGKLHWIMHINLNIYQ